MTKSSPPEARRQDHVHSIHGEDRVKTWAACDAHRDSLAAWLRSRALPVTITAFGETVERVA